LQAFNGYGTSCELKLIKNTIYEIEIGKMFYGYKKIKEAYGRDDDNASFLKYAYCIMERPA
jgi:hypothetical protein